MKIDIRLESITKTIEIEKNCSYEELKKKIDKKFKDNHNAGSKNNPNERFKDPLNVGCTHCLCYLYNKQFFYISNDEDVKKYIKNKTPLLILQSLLFINDYSNCDSIYLTDSYSNYYNEKFQENYDKFYWE